MLLGNVQTLDIFRMTSPFLRVQNHTEYTLIFFLRIFLLYRQQQIDIRKQKKIKSLSRQ